MKSLRCLGAMAALCLVGLNAQARSLAPEQNVQIGEEATLYGAVETVYAIGGETPAPYAIQSPVYLRIMNANGVEVLGTYQVFLEGMPDFDVSLAAMLGVEGNLVVDTYCGVESGCYLYASLRNARLASAEVDVPFFPNICPDPNDPNVNYVGHSMIDCARIRFVCESDEAMFSNACGCGCVAEAS